ncbi:MAG: mycothiol synthase [Pseudonocardiales bacterium]|nr:mycothiol synthase [Pseudonocardiales bacterium]
MITRSATADDLPRITELQRRWDTAWFGAPEHDESEVREDFERVTEPGVHTRLVLDGDRLLAAAWLWRTNATLVVDPAVEPVPLYADLLPWFEKQGTPEIEALSRDEKLRTAFDGRGWRHTHSTFELVRDLTPDWVLAEPVWDAGIVVRDLRPDDAEAVHRLIYRDAEWDAVPGHVARDFSEWRSLVLNEAAAPEQQVLAWRDDRLVGASIGRFFSDGTGWISQLAVAVPERGKGLGKALLLESLHRRRAAGASALGLGVEVENRSALQMYLGVGLTVDREWMTYAPSRHPV